MPAGASCRPGNRTASRECGRGKQAGAADAAFVRTPAALAEAERKPCGAGEGGRFRGAGMPGAHAPAVHAPAAHAPAAHAPAAHASVAHASVACVPRLRGSGLRGIMNARATKMRGGTRMAKEPSQRQDMARPVSLAGTSPYPGFGNRQTSTRIAPFAVRSPVLPPVLPVVCRVGVLAHAVRARLRLSGGVLWKTRPVPGGKRHAASRGSHAPSAGRRLQRLRPSPVFLASAERAAA